MLFFRKKSSFLTAAFLLLTLFAVIVKSFIPAGFMPESGTGFTKLVICSGLGEKTILVPTEDENYPSHEKQNDICAYQILTAQKAAGAPDAIIVGLAPHIAKIDYLLATAGASPPPLPASFSARGPPSV